MTSDLPDTSELRRGKGGTQSAGDLDSRAREAAKTAPTIAKFARALGIPHDQAMAINKRLNLNVPILRADRKPSDWERKPLPKPTSKAKGAKS